MNLNDSRLPTTYEEADAFLGDRLERAAGNNTRVHRTGNDDDIAVRLYSTDVVTYHRDGTIELDSGGYQTVTTKDRMNRFTAPGFRVSSVNHIWHVRDLNGVEMEFADGDTYDYLS